jgi:DNA-binding winged helix-turn-helix (wHTH) protein
VTYRFGRFTLDGEARQLRAEGVELHLSPKAFTLLLMLIEHRQRVMSKEELQDRLWPSTFIGETNLATLAAEVRRALGESAQQSTWIRTVHRIGYRFGGPVIEGPPVPLASPGGRMYVSMADRQIPVGEGTTTIGRGSDAGVQIDAGGVSRYHARILVSGGQPSIEDLGSKNGTFVGGTRIEGPRALADGDQIRVGPVLITFRVAPATMPTETMTEGPGRPGGPS